MSERYTGRGVLEARVRPAILRLGVRERQLTCQATEGELRGVLWDEPPELGATAWLVQQWNPGTRLTLLDKPDSGTRLSSRVEALAREGELHRLLIIVQV